MLLSPSQFDHAETVKRLTAAVERRGLTVFARIDHAAGAHEVGLELADELVLLFGSPTAGTVLMQSDPTIGVELPLRMLVWRDARGVQLGYNDPRQLAERYAVNPYRETLETMAKLMADLANEAAG